MRRPESHQRELAGQTAPNARNCQFSDLESKAAGSPQSSELGILGARPPPWIPSAGKGNAAHSARCGPRARP
eukprot:3806997-Alexandrium_andersonii.AAC.1